MPSERQIIVSHLPEHTCWKRTAMQHEGILIHFISAAQTHTPERYDVARIRDIFMQYGVSAHYLILRDGSIHELVPLEFQAWHAGKSEFRGQISLNRNFIGIELAGTVDDDFEQAQYESLAELVASLMTKYGIPTSHIKGHEDVSDHNVRPDPKVDPGPYFDWLHLGHLLAQYRG